jgi:putative endonuclease
MHYVYLLRSLANAKKTYIGLTEDIQERLIVHNQGKVLYTSRYCPWELITFVAVRTKDRALELERYFKSGSGHAFARKHLW